MLSSLVIAIVSHFLIFWNSKWDLFCYSLHGDMKKMFKKVQRANKEKTYAIKVQAMEVWVWKFDLKWRHNHWLWILEHTKTKRRVINIKRKFYPSTFQQVSQAMKTIISGYIFPRWREVRCKICECIHTVEGH